LNERVDGLNLDSAQSSVHANIISHGISDISLNGRIDILLDIRIDSLRADTTAATLSHRSLSQMCLRQAIARPIGLRGTMLYCSRSLRLRLFGFVRSLVTRGASLSGGDWTFFVAFPLSFWRWNRFRRLQKLLLIVRLLRARTRGDGLSLRSIPLDKVHDPTDHRNDQHDCHDDATFGSREDSDEIGVHDRDLWNRTRFDCHYFPTPVPAIADRICVSAWTFFNS
jgi:hypothetical protein